MTDPSPLTGTASGDLAGQGRWALSPRTWLAAFVVFVCAAIIVAFIVGTLQARAVATQSARREAQNLAAAGAQQASDTFESINGALSLLADRVAAEGTAPAARVRLRESMSALIAGMPSIHIITIADEHGRYVVGNLSATSEWMPAVTGRPYFRYHRGHTYPYLHIWGPARTRVDGVWALYASRRLVHADGSFAGVALAVISLDYFDEIYAGVDIGRLGTIKLITDDGTVMARKPRAFIGRIVPHDVIFADPYRYEFSGSDVRLSALDGVRRLVAFQRLGRYPLVVEVALSESEYLAAWRSDTITKGIACALLIVTMGGLAWGLGAQIERSQRAERDLAGLALVDALTGLANRRLFDAAFEREWRRAVRDQTELALLMIDVDEFKSYNDRYGHQQGDAVLAAIARTIAANVVRPADVAARYGGEEFVVVLPATNAASAAVVAERVRLAVETLGIPHAGTARGIASVSVGSAGVVPARFGVRTALLEAADAALYEAKRRGRNQTAIAQTVL